MPSPRLPIAATGLAITLTTVSACGPSLEGTWSGYDSSGEAISLIFGTGNSLTIVTANGDTVAAPEGGTLKYEVLDELYPHRLYVQLARGDASRQLPLGIYKIERGRLVICDVKATQGTIGFIPIGEPDYEWPTDFTGDCYGLDRS